jgi:hypothetical protein
VKTRRTTFETIFVVAAPLALAIVEVAHPYPGDLLQLDTRTWLIVHYAQIGLFPLAAIAVCALIRGASGVIAAISRVAMFVFATSYVAFDTAAGVVTGILIEAARSSGNAESWRSAIDAVWAHRVVGGAPSGPPPVLAVLGSVAWSIGTTAAAIVLKRSGHSGGPVLVMAVSSFGIGVFKTHAWPGGPLTFGGLAIAAAWMLYEERRG